MVYAVRFCPSWRTGSVASAWLMTGVSPQGIVAPTRSGAGAWQRVLGVRVTPEPHPSAAHLVPHSQCWPCPLSPPVPRCHPCPWGARAAPKIKCFCFHVEPGHVLAVGAGGCGRWEVDAEAELVVPHPIQNQGAELGVPSTVRLSWGSTLHPCAVELSWGSPLPPLCCGAELGDPSVMEVSWGMPLHTHTMGLSWGTAVLWG